MTLRAMKEEHWRNTSEWNVRWRTAYQSLLQPIRKGLWKPGRERIFKAIVLVSKGVFLKLRQKVESVLQTKITGNKCEIIYNCSLQAWVTASDIHTFWLASACQKPLAIFAQNSYPVWWQRTHISKGCFVGRNNKEFVLKAITGYKKCDFLFLIIMNISFF